jgi:hypothetical protein
LSKGAVFRRRTQKVCVEEKDLKLIAPGPSGFSCFDSFQVMKTDNPARTRNNSENTGQTAVSEIPGAQVGAIGFDADLQGLIDAWPVLSETMKRKILRDVQRVLK